MPTARMKPHTSARPSQLAPVVSLLMPLKSWLNQLLTFSRMVSVGLWPFSLRNYALREDLLHYVALCRVRGKRFELAVCLLQVVSASRIWATSRSCVVVFGLGSVASFCNWAFPITPAACVGFIGLLGVGSEDAEPLVANDALGWIRKGI